MSDLTYRDGQYYADEELIKFQRSQLRILDTMREEGRVGVEHADRIWRNPPNNLRATLRVQICNIRNQLSASNVISHEVITVTSGNRGYSLIEKGAKNA